MRMSPAAIWGGRGAMFGGQRIEKHQLPLSRRKTFMTVDVLKKMNGNCSFDVIFKVDWYLR